LLAAAVAYSRVHTGVHYPADAVAGSLIGAGIGQTVTRLTDRAWQRRGSAGDLTTWSRR
jgi:membrane-associated phospholipid phosphatase